MRERDTENFIDWDLSIAHAENNYYNSLLNQGLDQDTLVDKIADELARCNPDGLPAKFDQEEHLFTEGIYPVFTDGIEDDE